MVKSKLFKNYIDSDYEFHISRNSADLIRNVYSEVSKAIYYLIGHITLIKESLILIVIIVLLTVANSLVAVLIFSILGLFSFFFFYTQEIVQNWEVNIFKNIGANKLKHSSML